MNLSLEKLGVITKENIKAADDPHLATLLTLAQRKSFSDLVKLFQSNHYASNYLFLPNGKRSYHLMLYMLLFSIDEYVTFIHENKQRQLEKSDDFNVLFDWFFNDGEWDYLYNFSFLCRQLRVQRRSVLALLIHITKGQLHMKKHDTRRSKEDRR